LTPVCSICDGTGLLSLSHLTPVYLHVCQLGKGGRIGEPRKIRELIDMDLSFSIGAVPLVWLPNGESAHFDPLSLDQGNHGPIDTQHAPLWCRLTCQLVRSWSIGLGCLGRFHVGTHPLGEAACGFGTNLYPQEFSEHLGRLPERHATGEMNQVFLLTRGECSGE